ncbi:hypothetical protein F4782DRAFT_533766 [Xylaria castorea]|nr:hypothetical protein F4782DRAFT_533766 [Xylaria castorea]
MAHLQDGVTKDYYAILSIANTDTVNEHEVKQSYKRLSLQTHPDKVPNDPSATARFQEVKEAYDTLIDPKKRRIYNIALKKSKTAETNQANPKSYDPNIWCNTWFFDRNKRPQSSTSGQKPYSAGRQRASDRKQASEQWYNEAQQSRAEPMDTREAMRAAQKATNERLARENADSQRRAEEEDLRARKNMEERARSMTKGKGKVKVKGKTRQNIFRNLPGSACWHRMQWNKELGERTCRACGRVMASYVYRCQGCSMSACRKCMAVVKK